MEQELVDAATAERWLEALDAVKALEPFVDPALVDKLVPRRPTFGVPRRRDPVAARGKVLLGAWSVGCSGGRPEGGGGEGCSQGGDQVIR